MSGDHPAGSRGDDRAMTIERVKTPFGAAEIERFGAMVLLPPSATAGGKQIRAAIYGAKALGATRIVEVVPVQALDRLLASRTYVVPHDLVDLTRGEYLTFFEGRGYGFMPQQTPFCPDMRRALGDAARSVDPVSAARGIVAAISSPDALDEAARWGAHVAGRGVSPAAFLARELELCYVPLCLLDEHAAIDAIITRLLDSLPAERDCLCARAMQATRDRGLIGEDWRTWL
jgi:5'-methylthioadenosine phosphorylase